MEDIRRFVNLINDLLEKFPYKYKIHKFIIGIYFSSMPIIFFNLIE